MSGYPSLSWSLADTFNEFFAAKMPNLSSAFRRCLSSFRRYKYFRFGRSYRYFRLSVAVVITFRYFFQAFHGRKSQTCLWIGTWNFNALCYSFIDISISGIDDTCRDISTSGFGTFSCRTSSKLLFLNSPRSIIPGLLLRYNISFFY